MAAKAQLGSEILSKGGESSSFGRGEAGEISRPPSAMEIATDRIFRGCTLALAWLTVFLVFWVVVSIGRVAMPAVRAYGVSFLAGTTWDANRAQFGILPAIVGTLYSSVLGLAIGTAFGLAIAVFLSEGFLATGLDAGIGLMGLSDNLFWGALPNRIEALLQVTIELLAAIPSVVYGLWGIFVVIPLVRPPADWLHAHLGWVPIFGTALSGPGLLPASIVLAIMVLPTVSAISRDALVAVPPKMREAAFGIGATRWEAIFAIFIPTAATGIFGAIILGFGRALGETMALAMLAGNANVISWSLFSPANTLAALLANHFPEAGTAEVGALMYAALVLLGITLLVNIIGTVILQRADEGLKGLR
ncbi:MAG TPA: phosphate ABC transporter permease subunit PstC [Candidatus Binataceae bacterium]|jgi:phosphate transport system permease protein|nr:phosphate ABC transporter permease subunit PstC [Candidatus Binataceae bacterium]